MTTENFNCKVQPYTADRCDVDDGHLADTMLAV